MHILSPSDVKRIAYFIRLIDKHFSYDILNEDQIIQVFLNGRVILDPEADDESHDVSIAGYMAMYPDTADWDVDALTFAVTNELSEPSGGSND